MSRSTDGPPPGKSQRSGVGPLDGLPIGVVAALEKLRPVLPDGLYLAGGTAVAMRLAHRTSRDLDFFFHGDAVDIAELEQTLIGIGSVVEFRGPGTLRGLVASTKVSFLQADLAGTQHRLEEPELLADVQVAGMKDLMAMKLKVLAERGELRDYYDVKCIDEAGAVSLEDGVAYFLRRYGLDRASDALPHLIGALGYLDDVEDDDSLPTSRIDLARWWQGRQVRLLRNLGTR